MSLLPPESYGRCVLCYRPLDDWIETYRTMLERAGWSDEKTRLRRGRDMLGAPFQNFWECAHHPISMENFFAGTTTCEHGCHTTDLKWYHSGERPAPAPQQTLF